MAASASNGCDSIDPFCSDYGAVVTSDFNEMYEGYGLRADPRREGSLGPEPLHDGVVDSGGGESRISLFSHVIISAAHFPVAADSPS